jgi:hypothetical protein
LVKVPSLSEIQQYLTGSWRMMMGKADGIRMLDISADGFWDSFFAIAIALPALIAGWVVLTNSVAPAAVPFATRLSILLRLATVDLGAWVLPLVAFVLAARPAGLADKVAHYVISSNWGSALIVWMMLPPTLLRMFFPATGEVASALSIGLFILSLVLGWRLTNSALGKGAGVASGVFGAMFVVSLVVLYLLQFVLGLGSLEPVTG